MAASGRSSHHLIPMALAAAASGLTIAIGAWAFDVVKFWQAGFGAIAALGVGFAVALPWARDIEELAARARSIGEEDFDPQPIARRTLMGGEIARSLIESRRRVNRMLRALEE